MPGKYKNLGQFFQELKRRKVIKVIAMYAATAFIIMEAGEIMLPRLGLPDWTVTFIIILLIVGFPISIILSWIFDVTPEGIKKTEPIQVVQEKEAEAKPVKRKLRASDIIIAVLVVVVCILIYPKIIKKGEVIELEKSIAVLAFEDMSPERDQEYFCDGIAEEIINALTQIEGLKVSARTSAFAFKNKHEDIRNIGKKLDVETLLEGSVRKDGNRLRITAQLINVEDGSPLWSERYDRDMEGIFDIQDEISLAIADILKIELLGEEKEVVVKRHTGNLEAYDYYLRGNESNFSLAYTRLAESYLFLYWHHLDRSEDLLMKSKQAIDAALEIDPELTETHIALGLYYYWGLLDYSKALRQFDIALNQSPKNPECSFWIAAVHRRAGNMEIAKESFKKAFELDPGSSRKAQSVAQTYAILREYAEAHHYYDICIRLRPDWAEPYYAKADNYVKWNMNTRQARIILEKDSQMFTSTVEQKRLRQEMIRLELFDGNYEEALRYLSLEKSEAFQNQFYFIPRHQYCALIYGLMENPELEYAYYDSSRLMLLEDKLIEMPLDSRLYGALGIAYAGLGQKKEAIKAGEKAVELLPIRKEAFRGPFRMEDLARIYLMVGEHEKALERIEHLLSIPGMLSASLLQLDPIWKPLENNPRFIDLLETYSEN
jgi:serine/threonine-protein kinase